MCPFFPFTTEHSSVYRFPLEWPLDAQREARERKVRRKTYNKDFVSNSSGWEDEARNISEVCPKPMWSINFQRAGHNVAAKVCPLASNNWETALRNTKHLTKWDTSSRDHKEWYLRPPIWGYLQVTTDLQGPGGLPSMGSHRAGHDWSDLAAAALTSSPKVQVPLLQSLTSKNCYVQNKLTKSSNSAIYHLCSLGKLSNAD